AVVELHPDVQFAQAFEPALGLPELRSPRPPELGKRVFKVGAASGLTWGWIRVKSASIVLNLGEERDVRFAELTGMDTGTTVPFAKPGDSGALVVGEDGSAIALLFALSQSIAFACPLDQVLSILACGWFPGARATAPALRLTMRETKDVTIL